MKSIAIKSKTVLSYTRKSHGCTRSSSVRSRRASPICLSRISTVRQSQSKHTFMFIGSFRLFMECHHSKRCTEYPIVPYEVRRRPSSVLHLGGPPRGEVFTPRSSRKADDPPVVRSEGLLSVPSAKDYSVHASISYVRRSWACFNAHREMTSRQVYRLRYVQGGSGESSPLCTSITPGKVSQFAIHARRLMKYRTRPPHLS